MKQIQTFTVPLYLSRGVKKKKNHWLNLNSYRNWQFHLSNSLKIQFKEEIDLSHLRKVDGKVKLEYAFFYPDGRLRDIDNSLSVIAKFSQDALVEAGILEDDKYEHVVEIKGRYGGRDKSNPHCLITIEEI